MAKGLEYEVYGTWTGATRKVISNVKEASATAISMSISRGGEPVIIDVLAWTRAAARSYAGDYGVEVYDEDPEASVHDRIVIRAASQGRIA